MKKNIKIITKSIILIALICYNLVLTILLTEEKSKVYSLTSNNTELLNSLSFHKSFFYENNKYFNLSKNDIIANISNSKLKEINDSIFFIILVPQHVCGACVSSLYSEIVNDNIGLIDFFMISEKNDLIKQKEWISYNFPAENYIIDKLNIFRDNIFDNQIVIMKVSKNLEKYDFMKYEPGLNIYLECFIYNLCS